MYKGSKEDHAVWIWSLQMVWAADWSSSHVIWVLGHFAGIQIKPTFTRSTTSWISVSHVSEILKSLAVLISWKRACTLLKSSS